MTARPVAIARMVSAVDDFAEGIDEMKDGWPVRERIPVAIENAVVRRRKGPAVDYVGIDLHKNTSQMCIYDDETERYVERRVRTEVDGFRRALEKRTGARVLLEASTESEWVAQLLEELGFAMWRDRTGLAQ